MPDLQEIHVIPRFGFALMTMGGRTAVAIANTTNDTEITFHVVVWCDTYEQALTAAELMDETNATANQVMAAITQ